MKRMPTRRAAAVFWGVVLVTGLPGRLVAQPRSAAPAASNQVVVIIDLPTALRLGGANSLDVRIAREKLAEARANQESATWQFFPWLAPGFAYRGHDNAIQNVEGRIIDVHRDSYQLGPALMAQVDVGDAIYKRLAARQLAEASVHAVEAQRQAAVAAAAAGYFDLARAQASGSVAREAVRLTEDYTRQIEQAVEAGIAFKGDALRARTQLERNQFTLRQAQEQQTLASARLAQTLRLDPVVELAAREEELAPIALLPTNAPLGALVNRALNERPELRQSRALVDTAKRSADGARFGPLVPAVGVQLFAGGLAGGNDTSYRRLGESEDYQVTLGWRLGPGGLFDRGRIRAADARLNTARLAGDKLHDEIAREVVESHTRVQSAHEKLATVRRGLVAAEEGFRLARERKEFGVGVVLETIQAEQELTRLRQDYFNTVGEFNQAQYQLLKATGGLAQEADMAPAPATPAQNP
jgi:outer membrane protein TolC